jgi:hypothetical protein
MKMMASGRGGFNQGTVPSTRLIFNKPKVVVDGNRRAIVDNQIRPRSHRRGVFSSRDDLSVGSRKNSFRAASTFST